MSSDTDFKEDFHNLSKGEDNSLAGKPSNWKIEEKIPKIGHFRWHKRQLKDISGGYNCYSKTVRDIQPNSFAREPYISWEITNRNRR